MVKVTVLGLSGCSHCEALLNRLYEYDIKYELLDANTNDDLADRLEEYLKTESYPIVIVSKPGRNYYLFRGSTSRDLGIHESSAKATKIGCVTTDVIADHIKTLINS